MATNYSPRLQSALDLRAFLTEVKAAGELKEISGAHWHLEIGALTELFAEHAPTPALLFDGIPDYPNGRRVLSNVLFSPLRQSLALGVSPSLRGIPLVQAVKAKLAERNSAAMKWTRRTFVKSLVRAKLVFETRTPAAAPRAERFMRDC